VVLEQSVECSWSGNLASVSTAPVAHEIAREQAVCFSHTTYAGRSNRGAKRSQQLGEEAPRWASRREAEE
jgi:hypothetical protein